MMKFIDLQKQREKLGGNIERAVSRVLDSGVFIGGSEVAQFEKSLCDYLGVQYCVSVGNGTDALALALQAAGIGVGDAVITCDFGFFATPEAVAGLGAVPVFIGAEEGSFNISTEILSELLRTWSYPEKPKAILAVDMFGCPANYKELRRIAQKYDILLIEDAAQGVGGQCHGEYLGGMGDIGTTSFFPSKPLGCYGDGGAVLCNDEELSTVLRSLKSHGQGEHKYHNVRIGRNSRLDAIQAAILSEKLKVLEAEIQARNDIAKLYGEFLADSIVRPAIADGLVHAFAQYTVRVANRDECQDCLQKAGIPSVVYYPAPLSKQPAFASRPDSSHVYGPAVDELCKQVLSLPMHPYLTASEVKNIADTLNQSFKPL